MSSLFLQKFLLDFKSWHQNAPIDLYLSFGAYVTSMIGKDNVELRENASTEEIADQLIEHEIEKPRNLYIATAGGLGFEEFSQDLAHPADVVVRDTQGYISGLNGVLPSLIGERLNIKTAAVMVETTGTEITRAANNFGHLKPALPQFLGLLATRKGLEFLSHLFDISIDLDQKITNLIQELLPIARQDLIETLNKGQLDSRRDKDADFRDKMYV